MSWRVAWIMARLAVLMVLNSPAPMRAEQLRVNLRAVRAAGVMARCHIACARQSILRIRHTPLRDEQEPLASRSALSFSAAAASVTYDAMMRRTYKYAEGMSATNTCSCSINSSFSV